MKQHGWREQNEFHWNHMESTQEVVLEQTSPEGPKKAVLNRTAHRIREAWRVDCYKKWQTTGGRVAKLAVDCPYTEKRAKKVRETFQMQDGTGQTIMTGAWMSPAALAAGCEGIDGNCLWCTELGHHAHICWECPNIPEELKKEKPPRPGDPLKARLGWPEPGDKGIKPLEWIKTVARQVWEQRYHDIRKAERRRARNKPDEDKEEDPERIGVEADDWLEAETDSESEREETEDTAPPKEDGTQNPKGEKEDSETKKEAAATEAPAQTRDREAAAALPATGAAEGRKPRTQEATDTPAKSTPKSQSGRRKKKITDDGREDETRKKATGEEEVDPSTQKANTSKAGTRRKSTGEASDTKNADTTAPREQERTAGRFVGARGAGDPTARKGRDGGKKQKDNLTPREATETEQPPVNAQDKDAGSARTQEKKAKIPKTEEKGADERGQRARSIV